VRTQNGYLLVVWFLGFVNQGANWMYVEMLDVDRNLIFMLNFERKL